MQIATLRNIKERNIKKVDGFTPRLFWGSQILDTSSIKSTISVFNEKKILFYANINK